MIASLLVATVLGNTDFLHSDCAYWKVFRGYTICIEGKPRQRRRDDPVQPIRAGLTRAEYRPVTLAERVAFRRALRLGIPEVQYDHAPEAPHDSSYVPYGRRFRRDTLTHRQRRDEVIRYNLEKEKHSYPTITRIKEELPEPQQ